MDPYQAILQGAQAYGQQEAQNSAWSMLPAIAQNVAKVPIDDPYMSAIANIGANFAQGFGGQKVQDVYADAMNQGYNQLANSLGSGQVSDSNLIPYANAVQSAVAADRLKNYRENQRYMRGLGQGYEMKAVEHAIQYGDDAPNPWKQRSNNVMAGQLGLLGRPNQSQQYEEPEYAKPENLLKTDEQGNVEPLSVDSPSSITGKLPLASRIKIDEKLAEEQMKFAQEREQEQQKIQPKIDLISSAYDQAKEISYLDIKNPFSTEGAKFQSAASSIMPALQSMWKGPMSDSDMKRLEGLMPQPTDTAERIEVKKKQMLQVILGDAGIDLSRVGVSEPKIDTNQLGLTPDAIKGLSPEQAQKILDQYGL